MYISDVDHGVQFYLMLKLNPHHGNVKCHVVVVCRYCQVYLYCHLTCVNSVYMMRLDFQDVADHGVQFT